MITVIVFELLISSYCCLPVFFCLLSLRITYFHRVNEKEKLVTDPMFVIDAENELMIKHPLKETVVGV